MKVIEPFDQVLSGLVNSRYDLPELLARLHAGREGHVGAQRFDTPRTSGHTTVKFCLRCEQDATDCQCQKPNIATFPAVSDRVGETAVRVMEMGDRAQSDLDELFRMVRQIRTARQGIDRLITSWLPRDAQTTDAKNLDDQPGCQSCSRLTVKGRKRWEPPDTVAPSTLNGRLETAQWLCAWCAKWVRATGDKPPLKKLIDHHEGKRVTMPNEVKGASVASANGVSPEMTRM